MTYETTHETQHQLDRENSAAAAGVARYYRGVDKAEKGANAASTQPAVALQKQLIEPAAAAIQAWALDAAKSNRSIHKSRVISALGYHHAAYLTLQHIINGLGNKLNSVVHRLGQDIEDNVQLALAMKTDDAGPLLKYLVKEKYKGAGKHYKVIGMDRARRKTLELGPRGTAGAMLLDGEDADSPILDFALTRDERGSIGQILIELVVQHTSGFSFKSGEGTAGLFQICTEAEYNTATRSRQQTYKLYPTENYLRYLEAGHSVSSLVRPCYEPMLIKPLVWDAPYAGGYLTTRLPVVKGLRADFLQDAHNNGVLTSLYATLNTLQSTAWTFNAPLAEVAQTLWEEGAKLGCWPDRIEQIKPAKPAGFTDETAEEFKREQPQAWRAWKVAAGAVAHHNKSVSRLTEIAETSSRINYVAEHVRAGNADFHEVYQADFRGRIYPVSSLVHTQGDDFSKAVFRFAEGKAIDHDGAKWLMIHLANSWANNKLDKAPIEDRLAWVETNTEAIFAAGTDPLNNIHFWSQAEGGKKPWQFLAGCMEYAGWLQNGVGFVSHMPVGIDGSCNGLQNYSAAMRSEEDGKLVNLVWTARPSDIYMLVAEKTNEILLAQSLESGVDDEARDIVSKKPGQAKRSRAIATLFAGRFTRGMAKRPTMTYAYSVSFSGIKGQLLKEAASAVLFTTYDTPDAAGRKDREGKRLAVSVAASAILKAIKETVKSAAMGMAFLQGLATKAGEQGLPLVWTLPDGFEVFQDYKKFQMRVVRTVVSGGIRVKKDKLALIQENLKVLAGLELTTTTNRVHLDGTKKDTRALVAKAKKFIAESNMLDLYRTEVEQLLESFQDPEFDIEVFSEARYMTTGIRPIESLEVMVRKCALLVLENAFYSDYTEEESVDEETGEITSKRVGIVVAEPTEESDIPAQVRGAGPNVIHSFDSCHLRMTVAACAAEGVTGFMMVHDSYGCHAADMTRMARLTREQFAELHKEPLFDRLGRDMVSGGYVSAEDVAALSDKFLKYGTLDPEKVIDSPFFFL